MHSSPLMPALALFSRYSLHYFPGIDHVSVSRTYSGEADHELTAFLVTPPPLILRHTCWPKSTTSMKKNAAAKPPAMDLIMPFLPLLVGGVLASRPLVNRAWFIKS